MTNRRENGERDQVDDRLTALEIKASFSEDLLDQLNHVIVAQQRQLDLLTREITRLRDQDRASESGSPLSLRDELPPHY